MYRFILFMTFILLSACGSRPVSEKRTDSDLLWSVRMANTVINRSDSLAYYVDRNPKWAYDVAFLGMAMDRVGAIDPRYSGYMEDWVDYFVQPDGSVLDYRKEEYNLDRIFPGRNVLTVYKRKGDAKYKAALDGLIEQLRDHPKTQSGGYWHKKIYPWQMWLDGIFMGSTYMVQYASEFDAPEWFDVAVNQAVMAYEKTLDKESGLLMHAWDESRQQKWCDPETGRSRYPWSRATGWYLMALTDILEYLPEDHPGREDLLRILQSTSEALLKVRDPETGLWFQVLNQGGREGNYVEGSGSAMFAYVFARAAHKGYLDKAYLEIAEKAFDNIVKELITIDDNGNLTMHNIVGGCGLGGNPYRDGSFEYYVNEKRVDNDTKGVAPFILAAMEMDK
jgi:unsaturated rhamnogalacturonyl hydrolase